MTEPTPRGTEEPLDLEQAILHQDSYRKVVLGEVSDPLFPPHPGPPESSEDELLHAAMEDPAATQLELSHPHPTLWRLVVLISLAVVALMIVFWRLR